MHQDQPGELDAYLDLGAEDIARLVLCLLVEEMLRDRLAAYRNRRPQQIECNPSPFASNTA